MQDFTKSVDYADAMRRYKMGQGILANAMTHRPRATKGTALGRVLMAYLANKGMKGATGDMRSAEESFNNQRATDLSQALGALRGDTPYNQTEIFPGEQPIPGLRNEGTGHNVNAMAQSLMSAKTGGLPAAGLQILAAQPKDNRTNLQKNYEAAKSQGFQGTIFEFQAALNKAGASNISVGSGGFKVPAGHMINPNKGQINPATGKIDTREVIPIPGSKIEREYNKPTATQSTASNYANRMVKDEATLSSLTAQGYDPTQVSEYAADKFGTWGNFMKSSEGQQYRQAQEDWVRAKLRKESGAVIADEEMEREIKVYFPQPGDQPEVLFQKEIQRMIAANGMIKEADLAYDGKPFDIPDAIKIIDGVRYYKRGKDWYSE